MLSQYLVQSPLFYHHPPQLQKILHVNILHHLDPAVLPGMPHSAEQILSEAPRDDQRPAMLVPPMVVCEDLARVSGLGILEIHPVLADDQLSLPVPVAQCYPPRQVI